MDLEGKKSRGRSGSFPLLENDERKYVEQLDNNGTVLTDDKRTTRVKLESKLSLVEKQKFSSKISIRVIPASESKIKSTTESKIECECPVVELDGHKLTSDDLLILRTEPSTTTSRLNEKLIGFYLHYLGTHQFTESVGFKFFDPRTTHCITQGKRSKLCCFINATSLQHIRYMFWPVSDHSMEISTFKTGTNWSLLVYSRTENTMAHFNPLKKYGNNNNRNARRIYDKLAPILSPGMPRADYRIVKCLLVSSNTSQDSGIHLLCNAETVADYALEFGGIKNSPGSIIDDIRDMKWKIWTAISQTSDGKVPPPDSVFLF